MQVQAVALDAMGVIYPVADDLRELLIPYLRSKGCTVPDNEVIDAYRACYRDGATARSIWDLAGCDWADGALEHEFLACYELNAGVIEFLEAMHERSIPVYGLSNDVGEWAPVRRRLLGIDQFFSGWAISSEVRKPKPAPEIYQRLIDMLPCPAAACVFVDDRAENLDAAVTHGLRTVLYASSGTSDHPAVASFQELGALVEASA
jgi:FMN phosphatase YigB (HAD superfamily)